MKEVPFFQGLTIDQLKILAALCEEKFFEKNAHIFNHPMLNWLGKLLNIRSGEWARLLSIAFVLVITALGTVWALNVSYATFKEVGQDAIIWVQFSWFILLE